MTASVGPNLASYRVVHAYTQLTRVFKQAPWRVQTQVIAAAAVFAVGLAAIGGLYLATATRAATAGRDIQRLDIEKADLLHEMDELQADIAAGEAVSRLEARARELGFAPASPEQVEYLVVPGYPAPPPPVALAAPAAGTPADVPLYDETLSSWLADQFTSWMGGK